MIYGVMCRNYTEKLILVLFVMLLSTGCARPESSYEDFLPIDTSYPEQALLSNEPEIFLSGKNSHFTIRPRASYRIGAVVRSKKAYKYDQLSEISPYDLALVWGFLADEHFYKQVKIYQGGRRYFFRPRRGSQLSLEWIFLNSANHHIIPANENIRKGLSSVRTDDRVELEGLLVDVYANVKGNTFNWNTSLVRNDRGDGSCEIIYLKKLKVNYRVYK